VLAKASGTTTIYVWDEQAKDLPYKYQVTVAAAGLAPVVEKISQDLSGYPHVRVRVSGETIFLEGTAKDAAEAARVEAIAKAWAQNVKSLVEVVPPDNSQATLAALNDALGRTGITCRRLDDGSIAIEGEVGSKEEADAVRTTVQDLCKGIQAVNLVRIAPQPTMQVLIRSKVVEVNRTEALKLGIDWLQTTGATVHEQPFVVGMLRADSAVIADNIEAHIEALINDNKATLLSEPRMLVMDGETANILVGGELPVPVPQATGAAFGGITIDWKKFGVSLDVTPRIGAEGIVTLDVSPEVSNLDYENGITLSGFQVPALRSRKADTAVQVRTGETVVIGGLLQNVKSKLVKKIPILGDIPILGHLFRRTEKLQADTDLVIFVTPEIVQGKAS